MSGNDELFVKNSISEVELIIIIMFSIIAAKDLYRCINFID